MIPWWTGFAALAAGLAAGAAYLFATRRDRGTLVDATADVADAQRRTELLVEQLRELAEERHKLDEARYAADRVRLEADAANALRDRDRALADLAARRPATSPPAGASAAAAGFWAARPQLKGAVWGGGVVAFLGVALLLAMREQTPRVEGGPMAGAGPTSLSLSPGATGEVDGEMDALVEAARRDPADLSALVQLAHALLLRQAIAEARDVNERALRLDPIDVEARAHRAFIRGASGDDPGALAELERLVNRYPNADEPYLFRGIVAMRLKDRPKAIASLERFIDLAPAGAEMDQARRIVASLKTAADPAAGP